MCTAVISAMTGIAVCADVAMTGEITLSGHVLPVGGIKEKVLAARRLGVFDVALPKQNEKDINEDLSPELRREINVHYISTIDEALKLALLPVPGTQPPDEAPRDGSQVHETVQ